MGMSSKDDGILYHQFCKLCSVTYFALIANPRWTWKKKCK